MYLAEKNFCDFANSYQVEPLTPPYTYHVTCILKVPNMFLLLLGPTLFAPISAEIHVDIAKFEALEDTAEYLCSSCSLRILQLVWDLID